jgi:hypothetical protein
MRYLLLVAAVLFLLGTAAHYVGLESDEIGTAREVVGVVMALGVLYMWLFRSGDSTAA